MITVWNPFNLALDSWMLFLWYAASGIFTALAARWVCRAPERRQWVRLNPLSTAFLFAFAWALLAYSSKPDRPPVDPQGPPVEFVRKLRFDAETGRFYPVMVPLKEVHP